MASFVATFESPLLPDPNFPSGYIYQFEYTETFDWTRNQLYAAIIGSSVGGIAVTNLSTMTVISTTTLDQMYALTFYGNPPGSPPTQQIFDIACGPGTDIYMLMDNGLGHGAPGEFCRFTRVDPGSMVVTGEFYLSASFPYPMVCVAGTFGVVNTTTNHTIVAYLTNFAEPLVGPQIFNGTSMLPLGLGPVANYSPNENTLTVIPGKASGGSCDFLMINSDNAGATGNVDIWRINIPDTMPAFWTALHVYAHNAIVQPSAPNGFLFQATSAGTSGATEPTWPTTLGNTVVDGTVTWTAIAGLITSTLTGTANISSVFTPSPHLFIVQTNYDTTHDTILLWLTNSNNDKGPPIYLVSVNYNGSINWSAPLLTTQYNPFSRGASQLVGSEVIVGNGAALSQINTASGAVTATGTLFSVAGSFVNVYESSAGAYYTYSAGGFTRVTITFSQGPFVMRPSR